MNGTTSTVPPTVQQAISRAMLRFRGEFINILNHPNFGSPISYLTSPQFGYSTQTLNAWLGGDGQIGGPRSVPLALKLLF